MIDETDMVNGVALPPYRFAVHTPKLKMGLPVRGGLPPDGAAVSANRRGFKGAHVRGCRCAPCQLAIARNTADPGFSPADQADTDAIDALADPLGEGWEAVMTPIVEPFLHLAQRATSFQDYLAEVDAAFAGSDPNALIRDLAIAAFKARGLGDGRDDPS